MEVEFVTQGHITDASNGGQKKKKSHKTALPHTQTKPANSSHYNAK